MSDIALRLHKDMLVLSAPLDAQLQRQGFDASRDSEFITLFEPDSLRDALRLEILAGATCLVTNTANITPARLASLSMEGRAQEFAAASLDIVRALTPQHVLVEVGPCGLPLDVASKASLNENRDQYARAVRTFKGESFDAFFLNGFMNCVDLKCALMGLRQASDMPVFASVDIDANGTLVSGRGTLEEAIVVMSEYGATVAGFSTQAEPDVAVQLARRMAEACDLPLLVQLAVVEHNPKQGASTPQNPYYCPDVMVEAATVLRATGVQFLRATGEATPAYTGALAAAVTGFNVSTLSTDMPHISLAPKAVSGFSGSDIGQDSSDKRAMTVEKPLSAAASQVASSSVKKDAAIDDLVASARAEIAAAIGKEA